MRRLTPVDAAFLALESRRMPLHVGLLSLYRPPEGSGREFVAQIADRLKQSVLAASPFNLRPGWKHGFRAWESDDEFDLSHHFTHTCLPQPGRVRELLSLVSQLQAGHLDRAYPLWSMHLIEGLEDGRIATFIKVHHSVADGVGIMRIVIKAMSHSQKDSIGMPPPWELQSTSPTNLPPLPASAAGPLGMLGAISEMAFGSIPAFASQLLRTWRDYRSANPHVVASGQAPRCMFNKPVTGARRVAAQSYAMTRFRAISASLECSTNDVVLAVTSAALRRYLMNHHALPKQPLIAVVPTSVRREESRDIGNEIAFALLNLATDVPDPVERLRVIAGGMRYNKERFAAMSPAQIKAYSVAQLIPGAIRWLNRLDASRVVANLVISHVPAPRKDLYWQGCKVDGLYPASVVVDSMALNVTVVSRLDAVDFGLVGCRKALPGLQRLLDCIEQGIDELEQGIQGLPGVTDAAKKLKRG